MSRYDLDLVDIELDNGTIIGPVGITYEDSFGELEIYDVRLPEEYRQYEAEVAGHTDVTTAMYEDWVERRIERAKWRRDR